MFIRDGNFLYFLGWRGWRLFFKLFYGIRAEGIEKIPEAGGIIIASNHVSAFDPPAIGSVLPRAIYYMAKKELFANPVFGWVLRKVNTFPVSRGGSDIGAIREAGKVLESGKILLLFPQGGRRSAENLRSVKGGAGMLACRTRSPIVPCAVISQKSVEGAKRITIRFSDPLYPPAESAREDYDKLSRQVMERIQVMLTS